MKTRTNLKGGKLATNNNETLVKDPQAAGLKVKTRVRGGACAGGEHIKEVSMNNNETLVKDPQAAGMKIKTRVRSGAGVHFKYDIKG